MSSTETETKSTYKDYLKTPPDQRYELIGGNLILVPSPSIYHQEILKNIILLLENHVREHGLGEVIMAPADVKFTETDVVQPDLLFISQSRMQIIKQNHIEGSPDLVVEVLSEETAQRDRTEKKNLYYDHGVKEYWLVSPEAHSVEILIRGENDFERKKLLAEGQTLTSDIFPELNPTTDKFFQTQSTA